MSLLLPREKTPNAAKTKPQPPVGEVGELANRSEILSLSKGVGGAPDVAFPKIRFGKANNMRLAQNWKGLSVRPTLMLIFE